MAKQLSNDYDFSVYPWSQWFNGQVWRCFPKNHQEIRNQGTEPDFSVRSETFRSYVKAEAKARGVAVDTKVESDGCVVFRARVKPNVQVV